MNLDNLDNFFGLYLFILKYIRQSEQVAASREIADRMALDEIAALLVNERLEGDEIQLAVRGDQEVRRVSDHLAKRLQNLCVQRLCPPLHIGALRISQRQSQRGDRFVDRFRARTCTGTRW